MSAVRSAPVAQSVDARSQEITGHEEEGVEDIVLSLVANSETLTNAWFLTHGQTTALADRLVSQANEASSLVRLLVEREQRLVQTIEQLHQKLEFSRADVIRYEASFSWRMTRPLRVLSRLVFGSRVQA